MSKPIVLVVEDEPGIADTIHYALASDGFEPLGCASGAEAIAAFSARCPALAILDVGLPDMNGFELFRRLQELPGGRDVPMVFLTARSSEIDRVVGLELGADDYLPKPFEPRELVARIQTVLRRKKPTGTSGTLQFDGLLIDPTTRAAFRQGEPLELTSTEFDLLLLLAREPGKVFTRDDILNHLRGREAELYTRAVDIVVSRLRKKLEPLDAIKTLRNAGYALALRPSP